MAWLVAPGNHVATLDTRKPSTVGSHPACTLVMREELGIALQHYRIVPYGSEAAELHSLAPLGMEVKLNGQVIDHEPLPLSDRDTITTGELKLIFRLTDPGLDEIKPTALLEKNFVGEAPTGQAAREIAASDAPVPVFQTPAPVAGESHLTPLALESLENVEPTGPGQLPGAIPFPALEAAPAAAVPTQGMDALPTGAQHVQAQAAPVPIETPVAPMPTLVEPAPVSLAAAPVDPLPAPVPDAPVPLAPTLAPVPAAPVAASPAPVSPAAAQPVVDAVAPASLPPVAEVLPLPAAPAAITSPAPVASAPPIQPAEITPEVNPLPLPQEIDAPVAPAPIAPAAGAPPALPGLPDPLPATPVSSEAPAPPSEVQPAAPAFSAQTARPAELFLPKKAAPKRATDAGRRAEAARRTSMRWGFRMLGVVAAAAWILVAVYAFVDPVRNMIHDAIGYDPLAGEKIEQIEATVDAKNPAPAGAVETTPASGVADQD